MAGGSQRGRKKCAQVGTFTLHGNYSFFFLFPFSGCPNIAAGTFRNVPFLCYPSPPLPSLRFRTPFSPPSPFLPPALSPGGGKEGEGWVGGGKLFDLRLQTAPISPGLWCRQETHLMPLGPFLPPPKSGPPCVLWAPFCLLPLLVPSGPPQRRNLSTSEPVPSILNRFPTSCSCCWYPRYLPLPS